MRQMVELYRAEDNAEMVQKLMKKLANYDIRRVRKEQALGECSLF